MGTYYAQLGGVRILNATRADQSGADNVNVTDWAKTNDFILAVNIYSVAGKDTVAAQYKLKWRALPAGSFVDMASTGAINYSADTDLVNGAAIAVGGRKCSTQGYTWQAGEEVEGAINSDSIDLATDYETEIHFALDCSGATDNTEYEFELWDDTVEASRGLCGATIKIVDAAAGWLSGWSYAKDISLAGQSGAGTLYQVELDIGASAGGDFHLENHCTNFPQDIEVTDNDGTTLLKFWIEDLTADPLKMWVRVADDLGSNQTIRVYYGKSGATTNSDPETTFEFGDDFEDGDTNQWTDESGSTFVVDSGIKKYGSYSGHHSATTAWDESYTTFTSINTDRVVDVWLYKGENDARSDFLIEKVGGDYANSIEVYFHSDGKIYYFDGATHELQAYSAATWYHFVYTLHSAADYTFDLTIDGTSRVTGGGTRGTVDALVGIGVMSATSDADLYVDNLFLRKYVSPEPAFSSAGAEQSAPVGGVAPTAVFYGPLVGPFGGPI